jgi:hypothetical protein
MKKNKHQQRIFKKVIKKVSKGYFKDFESLNTLIVRPDDTNDHTLKKELNDHTKPEGEKLDSSKN